ncbi:MAG: hypothetical protein OXL96_11830 [Candidatus Poribacteria bacterium]|nr:hypothetical protein [Candidatus Poribacteria bacterium]
MVRLLGPLFLILPTHFAAISDIAVCGTLVAMKLSELELGSVAKRKDSDGTITLVRITRKQPVAFRRYGDRDRHSQFLSELAECDDWEAVDIEPAKPTIR